MRPRCSGVLELLQQLFQGCPLGLGIDFIQAADPFLQLSLGQLSVDGVRRMLFRLAAARFYSIICPVGFVPEQTRAIRDFGQELPCAEALGSAWI